MRSVCKFDCKWESSHPCSSFWFPSETTQKRNTHRLTACSHDAPHNDCTRFFQDSVVQFGYSRSPSLQRVACLNCFTSHFRKPPAKLRINNQAAQCFKPFLGCPRAESIHIVLDELCGHAHRRSNGGDA